MRAKAAAPVRAFIAVLGLAAMGAAGPPPHAPAKLSETGLYAADGTVDPGNVPFVPQYPLWSDGAVKSRWIRLPAGAKIDVSDVDFWRVPVGTRIWKEFAWNGRKVETRLIWRANEDSWVFATYAWNDEQTDALLAPDEGVVDAAQIASGKWHSIPGLTDCARCHLSSPSVVLGFSALQLSDDRDPLAPHAEPLKEGALTLRSLVAADLLDPPRPELARTPPRIRTNDPTERAALGYLSANCGGCHNGAGPLAVLDMRLLHDVAGGPHAPEPALATAVNAPGHWIMPGLTEDRSRLIAPGAPERSAVVARMSSRRPSSQMPPLGTNLADEQAVALITRWIRGLSGPEVASTSPVAVP